MKMYIFYDEYLAAVRIIYFILISIFLTNMNTLIRFLIKPFMPFFLNMYTQT